MARTLGRMLVPGEIMGYQEMLPVYALIFSELSKDVLQNLAVNKSKVPIPIELTGFMSTMDPRFL